MTTTKRDQLREEINGILAARKLRPFSRLGDASKGQSEITGINTRPDGSLMIFDDNERFFTDITFKMKAPNGSEFTYKLRFNANSLESDGAVLPVVLNNRFFLIKQWRTPLGEYTVETPRGFANEREKACLTGALGQVTLQDLPAAVRAILIRELDASLFANAVITTCHLGDLAENSGTHAVRPSHYLIRGSLPEEHLQNALTTIKGKPDSMVKMWEPVTVFDELGGAIFDQHSISASTLALKQLGAIAFTG